MFLTISVSASFTIIYFLVTNTVVVTAMVTPNALLIISACLCGISRKIALASKRLAVSQLQVLCSVLCSCIVCFCVFIIIYYLLLVNSFIIE